jgi:superfamily II RNA helicase
MEIWQVKEVEKTLLNGIGYHHAGLLPILKEIVEFMFERGYINILFATTTFAMGLNMPARSVMFSDVKKFDGKNHKYLVASEYLQMAGRAGRRGLDDKGTVLLYFDKGDVWKHKDA